MKTTKKIVGDTLNAVDVFDDPIHFNMEGNRTLSSYIGGMLSLAVIIFIATQAIIQFVGMFNYDYPTIIQIDDYMDDPESIYLNQTENFILAVVIRLNSVPINISAASPVSFTSSFCQYIRDDHGNTTKIKSRINWAPCNESDFESMPAGTFQTYTMNYAFCPTFINFTDTTTGKCPQSIKNNYPNCIAPPNFNIKGTFLSSDFEFIQFKLTTCKQADTTNIYGLTCDTAANIDTTFLKQEVQIAVYFSNTLITPVDYHRPNKTFLDNIYWNVNPVAAKVADIFLDGVVIQNIDDFFSRTEYKNLTFYNIQSEKTRELQEFRGTSMFTWNLRRSSLNHVTSRRYVKILEVISNVGGMSSLIMLACAFVIAGYSQYKYQMILSNELYDFDPIEQQKPKPANKSVTYLTTIGVTESSEEPEVKETRPLFSFLTPRRSPRVASINTARGLNKSTVKDYFELQRKKERILPYSEMKYVRYLFRKLCRKKDVEEELALKARTQVIKDLDVITIIQKLQEIDKLKNLLLNKYQREAFNFIEKPVITLNQNNPKHRESLDHFHLDDPLPFINKHPKSKFSGKAEYKSLSKYAKLYTAYRHLIDDSEPGNKKYNKKLLDMIGDDLTKVFRQVDNMLEEDANPQKFEQAIEKILNEPIEDILSPGLTIRAKLSGDSLN